MPEFEPKLEPESELDSFLAATGGSGGSTMPVASSGGMGASAGATCSGGIKLSREPGSIGKIGYGISALGSRSVHGHPANFKTC